MATRTLFIQGDVFEVVRHTVWVELEDFEGTDEDAVEEALKMLREDDHMVGGIEWVGQETENYSWAENDPAIVCPEEY